MTALLHCGRLVHVRHTPFRHRFAYRMWMMSAELDALDALPCRLFAHNRAAPVSLHDRDHGPRDGTALRPWVERHLRQAGLERFGARIRLLVIPRVLGFGFNPIAFYFCTDEAGTLGAVVHQVKNTFGGQTEYVLPVGPQPVVRQEAGKAMHVSPFFDMQGGYRFAFARPDFRPGGGVAIAIRYGTPDEARLTASLRLDARPMRDAALLRLAATMPLMPLKVVAAIHWQALRLWVKGATFHPEPEPRQTGGMA